MAGQKINKRDVAATVLFAINNIPYTDEATLERFLDLVNATGNFGPVSHRELIQKMILLKKHVPQTCDYSLLTLAELLGIQFTAHKFENAHLLLKEINHQC
jgi:hypothetical protein